MSARHTHAALGAVLAGLLLVAPALAQEEQDTNAQKGQIAVNWAIPEAPAAAALDIGRSENSPPSIMRRLSFELLNSDEATGFAAETSPYLIYRGLRFGPRDEHGRRLITAHEYQNNSGTRALARLSLSAAMVRSGEEGDRAALALRWTAFNRGDPYYSVNRRNVAYNEETNFYLSDSRHQRGADGGTGCVRNVINDLPAPGEPGPGEDDEEGTTVSNNALLAAALNNCMKIFRERTWNATSLHFMATQVWTSEEDGGTDSLGPAGARYGAVLSYGFDDIGSFSGFAGLQQNSHLLLSVSHGENMRIVDENDVVQRRDETTVGLRLRIAPDMDSDPDSNHSVDRFHISGEAAWQRNEYRGQPEQEQWTYRIGAERRIAENVWLAVTFEDRSGDDIAGDEQRTGVQIRWALNEAAQFGRGGS